MKTKAPLFVALALGTAVGLSAQTVDFLLLQWQQDLRQTSASEGGIVPLSPTPYRFGASVEGPTDTSLTGTTFTSVTMVKTDGGNGLSFTFDSEDGAWRYEATPYATENSMTADFPTSGPSPYQLELNGSGPINSLTLPQTVTFPNTVTSLSTVNLNAPFVTLTNGTWLPNGTYLVTDLNAAVTISFNSVFDTAPGETDSFHYDIWVDGPNSVTLTGGDSEGFINYDPTTNNTPAAASAIPNLTIAAGSLIDGNTYNLEIGYDEILAATPDVLGAGTFAALVAGARTNITIVTPLAAVPEPSTYAALLGAFVLAGVVVVRRRKV
jgi:hypothetical protein